MSQFIKAPKEVWYSHCRRGFMGYHSSRQLAKEWHYYKITRIKKKHFTWL